MLQIRVGVFLTKILIVRVKVRSRRVRFDNKRDFTVRRFIEHPIDVEAQLVRSRIRIRCSNISASENELIILSEEDRSWIMALNENMRIIVNKLCVRRWFCQC